jgi:hypothetical protein
MYIMKFSTTGSFIEVLNENFIDLGWDMSQLDLTPQSDNYA